MTLPVQFGTPLPELSMNVSLTAALESFVEDKVKSGSYASASEVVRAGLRLLQEHDAAQAEDAAKLEALRHSIEVARAQFRRGEGLDGPEVFARLLESLHGRDESA